MDTSEHLNSSAVAPRTIPVYPGVLSGGAWLLGLLVALGAAGHDPCAEPYAAQRFLVGALVVALILQGAALAVALVRTAMRIPNAGWSLAGAFVLCLVSLPAAGLVYIAITGFCLTGDFVM